jgi:hypothetical protein
MRVRERETKGGREWEARREGKREYKSNGGMEQQGNGLRQKVSLIFVSLSVKILEPSEPSISLMNLNLQIKETISLRIHDTVCVCCCPFLRCTVVVSTLKRALIRCLLVGAFSCI